MVNAACSEIYRRWRRFLPEAEARAEADRFAARFYPLIDGPLAPMVADAELEATMEAVAAEMARPL